MGMVWLRGEGSFALTGMVRDNRGAPIAGALVSVASDSSLRRVTGVNGLFTIDRPSSTVGRADARPANPKLAGLGIRGCCFQVLLPASAPSGAITLSSVVGRKRLELPLGPYGPGAHLVELPELAPGVYSLWIELGAFSGSAHLIRTGSGTSLMPRAPGRRHASEDARRGHAPRRQSPPAVDTLLVRKPGYVTARSPILSYEQAGIAIVMAKEPGPAPETAVLPITKAVRHA